jgi:hypothetical protein
VACWAGAAGTARSAAAQRAAEREKRVGMDVIYHRVPLRIEARSADKVGDWCVGAI